MTQLTEAQKLAFIKKVENPTYTNGYKVVNGSVTKHGKVIAYLVNRHPGCTLVFLNEDGTRTYNFDKFENFNKKDANKWLKRELNQIFPDAIKVQA
jgi:hypothetical protein